jgi:hypothetical protein
VGVDLDNYHGPNGWDETNPNWYKASAPTKHYEEIMKWLEQNNSKFQRHTRWVIASSDETKFKFRYEKDYIMFTLRWT